MPVTRTTTAYNLVADALRRRILGGEFAPGQQMPPEHQLCEMFSASRITIRRALSILEEEMLIQRRQGSGTYISPTPRRRIPLLATDFAGSIAAHAPELERRLDDWRWEAAPPEVADALQTFPGDRVVFARRTDILAGAPVAYDQVHILARLADRLTPDDLAELHFLERWQQVQQIRLGHLTQTVEAAAADEEQSRWLEVTPGSPLLKEADLCYDAGGTAGAVFISYYRHDVFRLTTTIQMGQSVSRPASPKTE